MRLLFAYFIAEDAGSAQDIHRYTRVARELGHEVALYGWPGALPSFEFRHHLDWADVVVFIFEWTTGLRFGDQLDLARIIDQVPRNRRFVIDCDGGYNDRIQVGPDYNHKDETASRRWLDVCDSLSDNIFQPTLHPVRSNVRPFFFHGYDPAWERPLGFRDKAYGMTYVGHSKFRYYPMLRVLHALEPVREQFGRIALIGHGWDKVPEWASWMEIEDYFYTDQAYLKKMHVEFVPPCPFDRVIDWMSAGILSPVIYRPLFSQLRFVTCRTFETPAANTIPLFGLAEEYVKEIYGDDACELVLPEDREAAEARVADIVRRPEHYGDIVMGIREHLAKNHSFEVRLQELIGIVTS
jgi:hypothetical protein